MTDSGEHKRSQLTFYQKLQLREDAPPWPLVSALVFVIAYPLFWVAGQAIAATISGARLENPPPGVLIIGAILGGVVVSGVLVQWARRRQGTLWIDTLKLGPSSNTSIFIGVVVGLGASGIVDLMRIVLKVDSIQAIPPILTPLASGTLDATWLWAAILALVVGPVTEGLVFFGVLYPVLARDLKDNLVSIAIVAIVYTIIIYVLSATSEPRTWSLLVQPFLLSLVIGGLRAYSQSTRLAIVARVMVGLFFILSGLITAQ